MLCEVFSLCAVCSVCVCVLVLCGECSLCYVELLAWVMCNRLTCVMWSGTIVLRAALWCVMWSVWLVLNGVFSSMENLTSHCKIQNRKSNIKSQAYTSNAK